MSKERSFSSRFPTGDYRHPFAENPSIPHGTDRAFHTMIEAKKIPHMMDVWHSLIFDRNPNPETDVSLVNNGCTRLAHILGSNGPKAVDTLVQFVAGRRQYEDMFQYEQGAVSETFYSELNFGDEPMSYLVQGTEIAGVNDKTTLRVTYVPDRQVSVSTVYVGQTEEEASAGAIRRGYDRVRSRFHVPSSITYFLDTSGPTAAIGRNMSMVNRQRYEAYFTPNFEDRTFDPDAALVETPPFFEIQLPYGENGHDRQALNYGFLTPPVTVQEIRGLGKFIRSTMPHHGTPNRDIFPLAS